MTVSNVAFDKSCYTIDPQDGQALIFQNHDTGGGAERADVCRTQDFP